MALVFRPAKDVLAERWFAARATNPSVFDRLMSRVTKRSSSECWPNTYVCQSKAEPYGAMRVMGKKRRCSRVMYEFMCGPIPEGMSVMHTCDNPPCVNPAHLRLGTHHENMLDRMRKNRGGNRRGERNGRCKLTESDVRAIRASSEPNREWARKLGVTATLIKSIRTRKVWKHVE